MDHHTIETVGIPGAILMERAALGATRWLLERYPETDRVGVLCGHGNNGGDGLAMARLLQEEGVSVVLVLVADPEEYRDEAQLNWQIVQQLEIETVALHAIHDDEVNQALERLERCDVWCDALFGTGLNRPAEGRYVAAIDFLNRQPAVFAVDVPSGLDALTGQPMGRCVRAQACASFGLLKIGQAVYPGRHLCGETRVIDIGLPRKVVDMVAPRATYLTRDWASAHLRRRHPMAHKGDAGKLLILAGSHTMTGAAILCSRSAVLGGAGLVTVGTYPDVVSRIAIAVPEAMCAPLMSEDQFRDKQRRILQEYLDKAQVIAMGPGMGTHDSLVDLLQHVLLDPRQRLVLDADALNLIAAHELLDVLRRGSLQRSIVLTPHPGEMARLTQSSTEEVLSNPIEHAQTLAQVSQCIIALKTASTVVAAPDGRLAINSSGNPGMASGGMGDTLTGLMAAQLAVQPDPFEAACLAVWLHGAAGDRCRDLKGELATSATGLLDHLGDVLRSL